MKKGAKIKQKKLKVIYKFTEGVSKEETQERMNKAFGILFEEVFKNDSKRISK